MNKSDTGKPIADASTEPSTLCCRRCHTALPSNARFCITCGARVHREDSRKFDSDITEVLEYTQKESKIQKRKNIIKAKYGVPAKREVPDILIPDSLWKTIQGNDYLMGSPPLEYGRGEDEELHHVKIGSFKLMSTPVTFAMYDIYCEKTGRDKPPHGGWGRENRPVINISYWDAVDYIAWVNNETGWRCRLPTEAEWEFACRAGTRTAYWWGGEPDPSRMHYTRRDGETTKGTMPVGYGGPNSFGICDMHGNILEWCASEYEAAYAGKELADASRDRSNDNHRVLRGGAWDFRAEWARAASRFRGIPNHANGIRGFRMARDFD